MIRMLSRYRRLFPGYTVVRCTGDFQEIIQLVTIKRARPHKYRWVWIDPADMHPSPLLTFGFNLNGKNQVWKNQALLAVLRLYWRVVYVYRYMTKQDADGTLFHSPTVKKALRRILMEKILSY